MSLPLPGINLPPNFSRVAPASVLETRMYVAACIKFLNSPLVSSLLECHPNDIAIYGSLPEWGSWWQWAITPGEAKWKRLIPGRVNQMSPESGGNIPIELTEMLEAADQLTLPRMPDLNFLPKGGSRPLRGMSPKKAHEVSQMLAFIQSALSHQSLTGIKHVVDVGAGQGYLSRALSDEPLSLNVLALDVSEVQTQGAERRASNIERKLAKTAAKRSRPLPSSTGSLTHEMIHVTPQTLHATVSRWISGQSLTPVLFVALHACGTLTPDVLRCYLTNRKETLFSKPSDVPRRWYAAGLAIIGCCYNLMSPSSDFPMSASVMKEIEMQEKKLYLSYSHRSLAAQSPLQWTINGSIKATAELAVRKVVYRALYGSLASSSHSNNLGANTRCSEERPLKIGRLRDSAYFSFEEFVSEANEKSVIQVPIPEQVNSGLMSGLEVLHALRSRIGPVVESLVIADRYLYLTENTHDSDVFAFNLFEQELGSGRNVALAVLPHRI